MKSYDRKNPFADLSEITVKLVKDDPQKDLFELLVTLRVNSMELPLDEEQTFKIAARKIFVHVAPTGFEVDPVGKFGEKIRTGASINKTATTKSEAISAASIHGSAQIGPKSITANIGAGVEAKSKNTAVNATETKEKIDHKFATPIGNDTWQITEIEANAVLDSAYLYDTPLCKLLKTKGANRTSVTVVAYVKQGDLDITQIEGLRPWFDGINRLNKNKNREKILKILISKSLNEQFSHVIDEKFSGKVTLSMHEVEHEA